jgi:hypothetical protein
LRFDPRGLPDAVWRQAIGFALLEGHSDARFLSTDGRSFQLGIVHGLSGSGEPDARGTTGRMRVAVLTVREDFVQIVSDPQRGLTVWIERRALGDTLTLWSSLRPGCCVQLLHLNGAERVEARAAPRDDAKVVRAFNPPRDGAAPHTLEIVEVRGEWVKIANHFAPVAGEPEGFQRQPGWIRLRDARGRLVFWVVDPDSC